jgi:pimeloyl-ACP methyl ester carboxylesterase
LVLEKQPGPLDYRRPQDPVKPYPYNCVDVTFANSDAGITLAGTLTWPQGAGPFRTVVLIAGSGPQNRNEELMNHRPFLVLSDALTRAGIATLRYDKRGVGQSGGDYAGATSPDFAADARAAVQYLRGQASFVASSIGLVGHSEGGLLAPTAAYANPDVAFLVLLAGPGVPGDEVLISQARAIGAVQGMSTDQLDEAEALNRRLYACFRATSDPKELERQLRDVLTSAGVTGAQQDAVIAELNTPWMRFFVTYDPAPVLTRTAIPVLALNGSLDLQVLPDLNLPPIQAALQGAGNQQATVQKLAGLNHLFQHAITGAPTEYGSIDETMAPEVLAQVAGWITSL